MKLEYPQPQPIDDGEYGVLVSKGYGTPTGDICLDGGKWEMTLARVSAEDCDRLIKAAAEIKSQVLAYQEEMGYHHGTKHLYKGRCQLCGKPEDDGLHAEVITVTDPDDDESGEDATVAIAESSEAERALIPCCEHCTPQCSALGFSRSGHTKPCTTPGCPSAASLPPYASPRPGDRCKCGHMASSHHLNLVAGEFQYCNGCAGVDDCAAFEARTDDGHTYSDLSAAAGR